MTPSYDSKSDKLQFVVLCTTACQPVILRHVHRLAACATQTDLCRTAALEIGCAGQQLSEHVRKDSTVLVIINLYGSIDAQRYRHLLSFSVCAMNHQGDVL